MDDASPPPNLGNSRRCLQRSFISFFPCYHHSASSSAKKDLLCRSLLPAARVGAAEEEETPGEGEEEASWRTATKLGLESVAVAAALWEELD